MEAFRLVYRVQHVVSRRDVLPRLLDRLPPAGVEIVQDDEIHDPNPLRNYLRCLADAPPDVTHMVVLQDDVLPCKNFDIKLHNAISERPDDLISLFVGGLPGKSRKDFLRALQRREQWSLVYKQGIVHVVALVWPVKLAQEFLDWYPPARQIPGARPPYRSDDLVIGHWAKTHRHQVWATVPSLVEHPDDVPSLTRPKDWGRGDRGRRAVAFIDGNVS